MVVPLALVLSAGLGCMGDVKSCDAPTCIGIVLRTGNPLPKLGAWLTAVGVCSTALRTLLGPVLTCDLVVAGDIGMGASSRGGMLVCGDEANDEACNRAGVW